MLIVSYLRIRYKNGAGCYKRNVKEENNGEQSILPAGRRGQ
jgi:hypothetical protein